MIPAIYYFSSTKYDFLTQRPRQLFGEWRRLCEDDAKIYFIEPFRSELNLRVHENPFVLRTPFYFYFTKYGLSWLEFINRCFIKRMVERTFQGTRVAIACMSMWEPYLDKPLFDLICYDYLDALEVYAGAKNFRLLKEHHERLLAKSDIVFVTAEKLRQEVIAAYPGKPVVTVSNGVDPAFFRTNRDKLQVSDYRKGVRKVAGYVGAIYDWIDIPLVHESASRTPEIDYIMVGPVSEKNRQFVEDKPSNVYYLGAKPYTQVPAYVDLFDVALIPFVKSNISESTDPIKLYEYFAIGKPVVSTRMLQLERFNDGVCLSIADDADTFAAAIRRFAGEVSMSSAELCMAVADENSWETKALLMLSEIEKAFGQGISK